MSSMLGDRHQGSEPAVSLSGQAGSIGALAVPFLSIGGRPLVASMVQVASLVRSAVSKRAGGITVGTLRIGLSSSKVVGLDSHC